MSIHIGDQGRAVTPLYLSGKVEIAGRRHDARSDGPPIDRDTPIFVSGRDSFGLLVRPLTDVDPVRLPNFGQPVLPFHEAVEADHVRQVEHREQEARDAYRQQSRLAGYGAGVGFFIWAGAVALVDESARTGQEIALVIALAGGALAVLALGVAFDFLNFMGGELFPWLPASGVAGAIVGAMAGVPLLGLPGGMVLAALGAVVLPALLVAIWGSIG